MVQKEKILYAATPIDEWLKKNENGPEQYVPVIKNGIHTYESFWCAMLWRSNKGRFVNPEGITHVLEAVSLPSEEEIRRMAAEYAKSIDPLNITPEKQADIYQGFIEGITQLILKMK